VILAIVFAAVFRLWNFTNTLEFLGDQGRDAMIVADIFRKGDPVLIGPVTSTGNMYLGPLYYYFMVPFLWLTYPNPIGPAVAVAVLSIITTGLVYVLGRDLVGRRAAAIATFLMAFSSVATQFSRFSWNPNPAPLFGLLFLWFLWKTQKGQPKYWIGIGVVVAVLAQLHYVALLTVFIALFFWLRDVFAWRTKEDQFKKSFVVSTVSAVLAFCLLLSPLLLFDLRHDWINVRSLLTFVETSQESVQSLPLSQKLARVAKETHGRSLQLFFEITIGKQRTLNTVLLIGVLASLVVLLREKKNPHRLGYQILAVSYVLSVIGLSFYRSSVFTHYIAFFFPATFLIFGAVLEFVGRLKTPAPIGWGIVLIAVVGYLSYNVPRMPLRDLGWKVTDMQRTSETIAQRVKPGEKYNIVLLSETKDVYGMNYRYFLTTTSNPPLTMEHFGEVETLFIIDEQQIEKDVTNLPIYEIVVFPNHTPSEVYSVPGGPKITVLRKAQ
jgi:4-amino-4-deoxy-L-arabinose transferase-like glycosyltransferase